VPIEAKSPSKVSVGISALNTDASTMIGQPNEISRTYTSVTKGGSESKYPGYFFKPKENIFEGQRGSRYD